MQKLPKAVDRAVVAVIKLTRKLPKALANAIIEKIDTSVNLLNTIKQYENQPLPDHVRKDILAYNNEMLKSTASQQSPVNYSTYKNWYE